MTRIETVINQYLFVGGPADGQRIAVQGDPAVFYIDNLLEIPHVVPPADDAPVRVSSIKTHEYIRQRHVRYGIIYVHRDTLDMWEFERGIEDAQRRHKGMTEAEFDELYICEFKPEDL